MTLNTAAHIYTPMPPLPVFEYMVTVVSQGFNRAVVTRHEIKGQEITYPSGYKRTPTVSAYSTEVGQGLPCILEVKYGDDGPVDRLAEFRSPDEPVNPDDVFCLQVSFDTAYGYRGPGGSVCDDLHAYLLVELGKFLAQHPQHVEWKWNNEYTGEWHLPVEIPTLGNPLKGSLQAERAH